MTSNDSGLIGLSIRAGPTKRIARNGVAVEVPQYATVGLVVRDAVVVDCAPYARRWALGRDARQVWRAAHRRGADLRWLPDMPGEV